MSKAPDNRPPGSNLPWKLSVKAVIRDNDDRVLLLKRADASQNHPSLWDFPGGKVESFEGLDQSLLREVYEETALHVEIVSVLAATESRTPKNCIAYIFFNCHAPTNLVQISYEHSDYCWYSPGDLPAKDICPQFENVLLELNQAAKPQVS